MLHARGIRLLVDLIIGLPGDTAADVARGVDFLLEHGLGDEAQVFPLAVLPGTAMRADAAKRRARLRPGAALPDPADRHDGRGRSSAPRSSTPRTASSGGSTRRRGRTSFRATASPTSRTASRSTSTGRPPEDFARAARPGAQHVALWLRGRDLFAARGRIADAVLARIRVDPHARLDVVLASDRAFPLDVVDRASRDLRVRAAVLPLALAGAARRGRPAARHDRDPARRRAAAPTGSRRRATWRTTCFAEMTAAEAAAQARSSSARTLPGALVTDAEVEIGGTDWNGAARGRRCGRGGVRVTARRGRSLDARDEQADRERQWEGPELNW